MKIRLGYACVPITIDETSSHTLTYTTYKRLGTDGDNKLDSVIKSNFESLEKILKYNIRNDIVFFRMTSELLPLLTHPNINYDISKYKLYFEKIGSIINENNLRVDMHPSAYTVLNSINDNVVTSTINILENYQKMYEYMKINSYLILHVGSKANGKKEGMKRFIDNFNKLPRDIQKMIILENDDKSFNIRNVLKICEELKIPMVLDYHHFKVNKNNEKIEDYIEKIFNTWKGNIPKIHFSSPKDKKNKRAHHDYINSDDFIEFLEKVKFTNKDFDVMIEAKKKDEALFRLIRELKYKTDYKIEKNTIFL